jgi:hypothetical protein
MQSRFIGSFVCASVNYKQTRVAQEQFLGAASAANPLADVRRKSIIYGACEMKSMRLALTAFTAHCTDMAA